MPKTGSHKLPRKIETFVSLQGLKNATKDFNNEKPPLTRKKSFMFHHVQETNRIKWKVTS